MAVIVQEPIQEGVWQLTQRIQDSYSGSAACGVILAPCASFNQKAMEQLQRDMRSDRSDAASDIFYLVPNGLLGVVLSEQKLADAHYASLLIKDFTERQGLLEGQLVVASFPESGELTEQALSQLVHTSLQTRGESREIQLFTNQEAPHRVSSVLIADPDEVSREFVKLRLEMDGYEVEEAHDGREALEKLARTMPDLVITELNLTIVDGYQLIDRVNRDYSTEVIVLTDNQLPKNMIRAFELGAADYVTKPFSYSELAWRIRKLALRRM